jgi:Brp/Blh family beta-carotene 15,15'-monooxygenase
MPSSTTPNAAESAADADVKTFEQAYARATDHLLPWLSTLPWLLLIISLLTSWLAPHLISRYALYPLLIGIILLGLPHGALDHVVPARMQLAWGRRIIPVSLYLLAYIAIAAAYFGMWLREPLGAFVFFLAITVLHWGHGDLRHMEIFVGRSYGSLTERAIALVVRGSLPILVPIVAFPATAEDLYHHAAVGLGVSPETINLTALGVVNGLSIFLSLGLLAYIVIAAHVSPDWNVLISECLEIIVLLLFFLYTPAYFSVGLYFLAWHSLRHLGRLLILSPNDAIAIANQRWRWPLFRLVRDALPITLAAIGLLVALYVWRADNVQSLEGFIAIYLVLISALTAPHMVVVALMDLAKPRHQN